MLKIVVTLNHFMETAIPFFIDFLDNINDFTATFDQFNVLLLYKSIDVYYFFLNLLTIFIF